MKLPERDGTKAIVSQLREKEKSPHFTVRFLQRNPPPGVQAQGNGVLGVRSRYLISCYIGALEKVYTILTSPPFSWSPPTTDTSKRVEVYVMYIPLLYQADAPFTALDQDGVPYIGLSSRSNEPVLQNALHRSEVEAVHEVTHAFCMSIRPPLRSVVEGKWRWFSEATAVFMEGFVFSGNLDALRFGLDWSDFPEVSLDDEYAEYQSGFFTRYLARVFGIRLVARVWKESKDDEGPLDTLNRLLPRMSQSPSDSECRVFGEYAHDSCFLWDFRSPGFANEVFLRFGQRALTASFVLGAGQTREHENNLDHLACRYYRIDFSPDTQKIEVTVSVESAAGDGFRCFLSAAGRDQHRGPWEELQTDSKLAPGEADTRVLTASLRRSQLAKAESLIVTVANCGTRARKYVLEDEPHDDARGFTIRIRAS